MDVVSLMIRCESFLGALGPLNAVRGVRPDIEHWNFTSFHQIS